MDIDGRLNVQVYISHRETLALFVESSGRLGPPRGQIVPLDVVLDVLEVYPPQPAVRRGLPRSKIFDVFLDLRLLLLRFECHAIL